MSQASTSDVDRRPALPDKGRLCPHQWRVALVVLVVAVVVGGWGALRVAALFDPEHALRRLPQSGTRGVPPRGDPVRLSGVARAGNFDATKSSICLVRHESSDKSGKHVTWTEDWRKLLLDKPTVRTDDGTEWKLQAQDAELAPELLRASDNDREWRRESKVFTAGRYFAQCIAGGERVFVDGCSVGEAAEPSIGSCPTRPLVITTGDGTPQRRIDALAADASLGVAALGAGFWVVLMLVARWRGAPKLADRIVAPAPGRRWLRIVISLGVFLALAGCFPALLILHAVAARGSTYEVGREPWAGAMALALLVVAFGLLLALVLASSAWLVWL